MYKVKYIGCGQIEVDLPSYPKGVVIKHGEYANLSLKEPDKKVIKSLRHLGLFYEEEKPVVKPVIKPEVEQKATVEPVISSTKEAPESKVSEDNSDTLTKDELMKKTAIELRNDLKNLGVTDLTGSKSDMADRILENSK